jgi:hypothetical protein
MSGWKKWAALEVVQATQFQDYVQDQVVQVYAGTAARSSALGTSVAEGMVSYLSDINQVQVYNGSSWVEVGGTAVAYATASGTAVYATNAGTSVYATTSGTANYSVLSGTAVNVSGTVSATQVAGTAIFLNGTAILVGGSATVTGGGGTADFSNPMTVLGDLIVGGTAGVAGRLGIGTNGQYLYTNGTVASWNTISVAPTQVTAGTFNAGSFAFSTAVTTGNTLTTGNAMRNITMSTADPSGGADGDVWLKYTP